MRYGRICRVTAAEWFAGGQRLPYDPESAPCTDRAGGRRGPRRASGLRARGRRGADADAVWLTLLPGFPDGSYGWAQVDRMLGDDLGPRLYVEPVGQGDSDKPRGLPVLHRRARGSGRGVVAAPRRAPHRRGHLRLHLAGAARAAAPSAGADRLRRHRQASDHGRVHDQRRPVRRRAHPPLAGHAAAAHPAGRARDATGAALAARFDVGHDAGAHVLAGATIPPRTNSPSCGRRSPGGTGRRSSTTPRDSSRAPPPRATAGISPRSPATLAARSPFYVGGSDEDPYEHRQIAATRERVPQAEVLTFPGGHLTTSEHPDLLAAAIRDIAARHGVGTPAAAHR